MEKKSTLRIGKPILLTIEYINAVGEAIDIAERDIITDLKNEITPECYNEEIGINVGCMMEKLRGRFSAITAGYFPSLLIEAAFRDEIAARTAALFIASTQRDNSPIYKEYEDEAKRICAL